MQRPLNLSIPDHDFHYLDNGIYSVKCNLENGNFCTSVWFGGKVKWGVCPCCGLECKKAKK